MTLMKNYTDELMIRLNEIKFNVNYFLELIKTNQIDKSIDHDIAKRITLLKLKCLELDESSINKNIEAFIFLIDLWEKDIKSIKSYLFTYQKIQEMSKLLN